MTARPASETIRSPGWVAVLVVFLATLGYVYLPLLRYCFGEWLKPDYSHGFLVPLFAAYLAWHWRVWAPDEIGWPDARGLAFVAAGAGLFLAAGLANFGKELLQGFSLILNLCGVTLLMGGPAALRWLWPSLAFLAFMFPLPYRLEHALGWPLQRVAATGAEFVLQTAGYPSFREGVIIHCQDHDLEVATACNGLSMLLTFITLSTALALLVKRPWLDRVIILLSAVPIAVVSNILRIAATGILYNEAGRELGDKVFHDFAGWMMMPLALGMLLLELKLLDWVLPEDLGQASREDVIKMGTKPAFLFMADFQGAKAAQKPAAKPATPPAAADPPQGTAR